MGHQNGAKRFQGKEETLNNFLKMFVTPRRSLLIDNHRDFVFQFPKTTCSVPEINESCQETPIFAITKRKSLQMLREKLLKHKWGDATVVLEALIELNWSSFDEYSRCTGKHPELVRRVGGEILLQHPFTQSEDNFMSVFKRSMGVFFSGLDQTNLLLEYAFTFFANHDYASAKEELSAYDVIDKGAHKSLRIQEFLYWSPIIEAYLGLVEYAFWRMTVAQEPNSLYQNSTCSTSQSENAENHKEIAKLAVEHFRKILKAPGVWDLFILKHIEILLYYYEFDALQSDLVLYSENHLENPNAHKYLFRFLQCYIRDKNETVQNLMFLALQRLHKISPSDSLVIMLHQILFDKSMENLDCNLTDDTSVEFLGVLESFEIVMHMLDFCSLNTKKNWCVFHKSLSVAKTKMHFQLFTSLLGQLWISSGRNSWWPAVYFSPKAALAIISKDTFDVEEVEAKLFIASTFIKGSSKFCKTVKKFIKGTVVK